MLELKGAVQPERECRESQQQQKRDVFRDFSEAVTIKRMKVEGWGWTARGWWDGTRQ